MRIRRLLFDLFTVFSNSAPSNVSNRIGTDNRTTFTDLHPAVRIDLADDVSESDIMRLGSNLSSLPEVIATCQSGLQLLKQYCGNAKYLQYTKSSYLVFQGSFIEMALKSQGLPHEYEFDEHVRDINCLKAMATNIDQIKDNIDSFIISIPRKTTSADYFNSLRRLFSVKQSFESITITSSHFKIGALNDKVLFKELSKLNIKHLSILTKLTNLRSFKEFAKNSTVQSLTFNNIDDSFAATLHLFKNLEWLTIRNTISSRALLKLGEQLKHVREIVFSAKLAVQYIADKDLVLDYATTGLESPLVGMSLSDRRLTSLRVEGYSKVYMFITRTVLYAFKETVINFLVAFDSVKVPNLYQTNF